MEKFESEKKQTEIETIKRLGEIALEPHEEDDGEWIIRGEN